MRIQLTDSAVNDLRELLLYYEEQSIPQVGQHFVAEILDRIETLSDNPDIGRVVPEFSIDNIRELCCHDRDTSLNTRNLACVRGDG